MNSNPLKDYVDAKDEAITAGVHEYYAKTEARLAEMDARVVTRIADLETRMLSRQAEMEARLLRGQAEMIKWCIGITLAGVTVTTSVSAYFQASTLNQLQVAMHEIRVSAAAKTAPAPVPSK